MATLNEVIDAVSSGNYLDDPIQFIIDNDRRIISVPELGVVAGVIGDKNVNRINFQMNRYYNGFDMSEFLGRIVYVNAGGNPNYYTITDITSRDDTLYFTWLVDTDVVMYKGDVLFDVNLYTTDSEGNILQSFNTANQEKLSVLEGIHIDVYVPPELQVDILSKFKADAEKYSEEILARAQNALSQYSENEIIPKINSAAKAATDTGVSEISKKGDDVLAKLDDSIATAAAEFRKKICVTDEESKVTYVGELVISGGKTSFKYEEVAGEGQE